MKSREGRVVDADDILDELESLAAQRIRESHPDWDEAQINQTATMVATAAIRFFMIKFDPARDFTFVPEQSLSFEGDSGPYVQYTHARICSILHKTAAPKKADVTLLCAPEELALLRSIAGLSEAAIESTDTYKPNTVANQLLLIARAFNSFYHACPVLQATPALRDARLVLCDATRRTLVKGLALLCIQAPVAL